LQRALVTGGTGMLGSHLILSLLERGDEVTAIVRSKESVEKVKHVFRFYRNEGVDELVERVTWVEGNLVCYTFVEELVAQCDIAYHCAATVSFNPLRKNEVIQFNTEITANVVDAALKHGKRIIHVSSIASLSTPTNGDEVDEHCHWKSTKGESGYSISKFYSEMEVWRGIEQGLNAAMVNPAVIIGPGDWRFGSPSFFKAVSNGLPFYTNGGTGFVDVRDVVAAMISITDRNISGESFVLLGENALYRDFLGMIANTIGKRSPFIEANRLLLGIGWRLEYLRSLLFGSEPIVTKELAKPANRFTRYSSKKANAWLNMEFRPLTEMVEHTGRCFVSDLLKRR